MDKNENIEIKRIMNITKTKVILIAFILIISILLGYMYSYKYVIPEYKSTSTLLLIPNESSESKAITTSDLTLNSELISTYSNIAKQSRVVKQVITNLELNMTEQELLENVEVNVLKDTYIIKIAVTNTDAQMAADITRELANVFLKEIKEIYNLNNIGIVDEAQVASEPYNISHVKDIAKFFIVGLVVSGACIMCIYIFDNTIKTEEDIEEYVKIKSLGKIPRSSNKKNEIVSRENAKSYVVECINTIRTNILYMSSVKNAKTVLVTSCTSQEGKSFVSANIAVSFAETNKKVLLIDADMRKGRANKIFGVSNSEGLSNYLYEITEDTKKNLELGKKYIKETKIPNLHILTRGTIPPNPSELLDSDSMKELLKIAKNIYDVIIVDAPPCKLVTDSIILSTIVDSTILVASSENTKINDLEEVKKSIQIVGGKIIGSILNKVKTEGSVYKKSYYYGHSKEDDKCEVKEKEIISVNEVIEQAIQSVDDIEDSESTLAQESEKTLITVGAQDSEIANTEMQEKVMKSIEMQEKEIQYIELQNKQMQAKMQKQLGEVSNVMQDIKVQLEENMLESEAKNKDSEEKIAELVSKKLEESMEESELRNKENEDKIAELVSRKLEESMEESELRNKENEDKIAELVSRKLEESMEESELRNKENEDKIAELVSKKLEESIKENELRNKENEDKIAELVSRKLEESMEESKLRNKENKDRIANLVSEMLEEFRVENDISKVTDEIQRMTNGMKDIIKEEMLNINYMEQINQINEAVENLKDSYLELSNMVKINNVEPEAINNENIIDINMLKKQKQIKRKRKVYSLEEEIPYSELQESAFCVIPINNKKAESFLAEDYENRVVAK